MNKPRFTPGPWKILKGHSGYTFFICFKTKKKGENGRAFTQRAEIAHVYKGPTLVRNGDNEGEALASVAADSIDQAQNRENNLREAEANARLIAAAPEMCDFIRAVAHGEFAGCPKDSEIRQMAMRLFAKATGGVE